MHEIFRSGDFTDMNGRSWSFSEADVRATMEAYDPAVFRAPLVVGHPKTNDPAFGWVSRLDMNDGVLLSDSEQVQSEFAEMVNAGRFPKISSSFFHPDHKDNPVPGVWYLRHVGFLGAAAPAVKGLATASFNSSDENIVTIEFAESDFQQKWLLGRLIRNMREWMLERFGSEDADKVVTSWMAEEAVELKMTENSEAAFAAELPKPEDTIVPTENDDKTAEFAEREQTLQQRENALKVREDAQKAKDAELHKAKLASFAEEMVQQNHLLPAEKDNVVAFMAELEAVNTVSFADGDGSKEQSPVDFFKSFIESLPERVDFSERSADTDITVRSANFAAPQGYAVNPDKLELHNKALAYQQQNNCDYSTALAMVCV